MLIMTENQFARSAWGCARSLGLATLVLFGALSVTTTVAKADSIFDFNGTVGDIFGTSTAGLFTGLTETGTITINTIGGTVDAIDLTVEGDSNQFVNFFGCPVHCTYNFNNGFDEFGLLDIGSNLVGYTGGAIGSDSYVALDTPVLGSGDPEVQYYLSGTVSPALAATPEPRYYTALLGLAMIGSLLVIRRRRQA
jgi:MYXO-CTERM domain-containing protein